MNSHLVPYFLRVTYVVIGIVAAEILVRLLMPFPVFYSTWFDEGVHRPDSELGFAFSPEYDGRMWHRDKTWSVQLNLDEHGLRPAAESEHGGARDEVVLLGGASMVFGYGLPNDQIMAAQIAKKSARAIRVHTVAWPGFDLARDLKKLDRFVKPEVQPTEAVLFVYFNRDYQRVVESVTDEPPAMPEMKNVGDVYIPAPIGVSEWAGDSYFKSYLLAAVCREVDRLGVLNQPSAPAIESSEPATPQETQNALDLLRQRIVGADGKLLVVAIPKQDEPTGPRDLENWIPDSVSLLDLRHYRSEIHDWMAWGHYGKKSTEMLAAEIAKKLDENK